MPAHAFLEHFAMRTHGFLAIFAILVCCGWMTGSAVAQPDPRENFDRWDRNQDGQLDREELPPGVRENFGRLDANSDGHVAAHGPIRDRCPTT
jgi:hypothetical protein